MSMKCFDISHSYRDTRWSVFDEFPTYDIRINVKYRCFIISI